MKHSLTYQHSLVQAMRDWFPGQFFARWPVAKNVLWTAQRVFWLGLLMTWSSEQTLGERFHSVRRWLKTLVAALAFGHLLSGLV
jgi:hypothetical protein